MPRCRRTTTPTRRADVGCASWILFLSIACGIKWDSSRTATATAFSLASIFPRRTAEKGHVIAEEVVVVDHQQQPEVAAVCPEVHHEEVFRQEQMRSNVYISESSLPHVDHHHHHHGEQTDESSSSSSSETSVHLQLKLMHQADSTTENAVDCTEDTATLEPVSTLVEQQDETHQQQQRQHKTTRVCVHTFVDADTNRTWAALNTSRRKFLAFLEYNNITLSQGKSEITTSTVILPESGSSASAAARSDNKLAKQGAEERRFWRYLWKERQLITDRTELLAVYQSDHDAEETSSATASTTNGDNLQQVKKGKRGGFRDLLDLYANRLVAILQDEQHDERTPPDVRYRSSLVRAQQRNRYGQPLADDKQYKNDHMLLIKWLQDNYGMSETLMLQARRFRTLPVPAQLELMHHFLHWFRKTFPYYYDRCDACGASQKDDLAAAQSQDHAHIIQHEAVEDNSIGDEDDDDDDDQSTFLGYIYTDQYEEIGKASRTELYHCHRCGSFTRFPRYNSAFDIIQSRRGRCGEYSLLLYRFLRALNHDARWVVDWADHVWAEVLIGDSNTDNKKEGKHNGASSSNERWVHLDPCEAAVDNPLLYEEWGKAQTYILALYCPLRYQAMQLQNRHNGFLGNLKVLNGLRGTHSDVAKAPLVEDVTQLYTTDSWENICKRREESEEEVESAIDDAINDLESKLFG